jgi:hypothetical protein
MHFIVVYVITAVVEAKFFDVFYTQANPNIFMGFVFAVVFVILISGVIISEFDINYCCGCI